MKAYIQSKKTMILSLSIIAFLFLSAVVIALLLMTLRQPPCWPFNASNCPHPGGAFLPFPLHIKSGAGFPPGVVFFSAGEMPSFADKTAFRKADKTHCI